MFVQTLKELPTVFILPWPAIAVAIGIMAMPLMTMPLNGAAVRRVVAAVVRFCKVLGAAGPLSSLPTPLPDREAEMAPVAQARRIPSAKPEDLPPPEPPLVIRRIDSAVRTSCSAMGKFSMFVVKAVTVVSAFMAVWAVLMRLSLVQLIRTVLGG